MNHTMSMYANSEKLKEAIMNDNSLTAMSKLEYIFRATTDCSNLKETDPYLYHAILGVLREKKHNGL